MDINEFISKIVREYRIKRVVKGLFTGLLAGVIILFICNFLRIIIYFNIKPLMVILILIIPIFFGAILGFYLSLNIPLILSRADRYLKLEEMLITYNEYIQKDEGNIFLPLLKERLSDLLDNREIKGIFKIKLEREIGITAVVLICLLFLSIWMDFSANVQNGTENEGLSLLADQKLSNQRDEEEEGNIVSIDKQNIQAEFTNDLFEVSEIEFEFQLEKYVHEFDELEGFTEGMEEGEFEGLEQGEDTNIEEGDDFFTGDPWNVSDAENTGDSEDSNQQNDESTYDRDNSDKGERSKTQLDEDIPSGLEDLGGEQNMEFTVPSQTQKRDFSDEIEGSRSETQDKWFDNIEEEYKKSKLESMIKSSYFNHYIEELMRADPGGSEQDINIDDLISYRDFLINSLKVERIPATYKEMVKKYFEKIIKE